MTRSEFKLEDHPLDEYPQIEVIVIGAGISGITAGILLPRKVPNIKLEIFEKNADVGGVWEVNKYLGVRCDVPAHAYQYSFESNPGWTEYYAKGEEISQYWKRAAEKYDAYKYITFNTKVIRSEFNENQGKWNVTLQDINTGNIYERQAHILILATGYFDSWKLPDYPGLGEYEGHLRHTSNWDPSFDPKDKSVAVIGNGASGIQVLPQLQRLASHVDHYVRNPTWIGSQFGGENIPENLVFSPDQIALFKSDPVAYYKYRKTLENSHSQQFAAVIKGSKANETAKEKYTELMKARLGKASEEILPKILPSFSPGCRRLTPGPGYLEALGQDNVTVISTGIERFTKKGIKTIDGTEREVDAIICATGADTSFAPQFPIVAGEVDLSKDWRAGGNPGFPDTYLGIAVPKVPNFLFIHSNSTGYGGTLIRTVETQITYAAQFIRKVSQQGIKSIVPSQEATDDFREYSDAFFKQTVLLDGCSSWYNGGIPGGRIHGLWPGSNSQSAYLRLNPRWEDFEYKYHNQSGNRFGFLGNGWTTLDKGDESDLTPYLHVQGTVDLATIHEHWNSIFPGNVVK
ncbi:hypothetical protein AWJ20_5244 [Sugiyamaella lignohabitans]|uniref:Fmo1p n=1 Tax=Sugiyamaella lignohabitans TaxID=796027 RepID=A0A167ENF6_9ASCO|nr:uncharacterized protein AWJ20_5244 [Sugiyamaella lignohabitans]ANB14279.1 hypothetical protein AWJ20_5244 [Sugiyamaella lignohabitans]